MDRCFRTDIAIFDFSKALDSVPHCRLFSKLSQYSICGTVQNWLHSFLSDQYQRVVVNGAQSSWLPVLSGVPQGTVLGPLLSLIYINDIILGIDSEIRLFANDCIVYRQIRNSRDSVSLQSDINKMHEWSNKWQMSFSVSKWCILSIHRKRTPPALNYTLGNNTLPNVVNSRSYLGVTVTSDLRWYEHVNNMPVKATKTLNFIRRNVHCCPPYTKATADISLVRPHLEYAAAAWDPYLVGDCKQLEKVQRRAAGFVKRDYISTTSVSSLVSQLGWQTLADRRRNSRLSLMSTVFTVWLVFPPHLFVALPSPLVQLMTTHFVSYLLVLILTSTPILAQLLTGTLSRHLWSLVLPFVRSAVPYVPARPTPSNHTPIPAVTGGNSWPAFTEEPKNQRAFLYSSMYSSEIYKNYKHSTRMNSEWKLN